MPLYLKNIGLIRELLPSFSIMQRAKSSFSMTETQLLAKLPWLEQSPNGHAMAASARMSLKFGLNDTDTTSSYHNSDRGQVMVAKWIGMANTQEPNNVLIYQDNATDYEINDCLSSAADLNHESFVFGTPLDVFPSVKNFLEKSGCVTEEDTFIQCSTKDAKVEEEIQLNPGLRMKKMKADRADLVASHWIYNYPGTSLVAALQLERGYGMEIVDQDDNPVSWILTMKNGETGMGYTIPEYRHQRLNSIIIYALHRELRQSGMYISGYIQKPKEGSQMVFPSITLHNPKLVMIVWAKYYPTKKSFE